MLFFPSSTQLPNSEVPIKLIQLEVTIGFGFLNTTRSQGPDTLGKIRSATTQEWKLRALFSSLSSSSHDDAYTTILFKCLLG